MNKWILFCCWFFFSISVFARENNPQELLKHTLEKILFTDDVSMQLQVAADGAVVETYMLFRRDAGRKALLLQQQPEAMQGTGYLSDSGKLWLYNPVCRCFELSQPGRSFAGRYLYFSDIFPGNLETVEIKRVAEEVISGEPVTVFEYVSGDGGIHCLYISRKNSLPIYTRHLNARREEIAVMRVDAWGEYKNKYIPLSFTVFTGAGDTVLIRCSDVSFQPLSDAVFTKSYLLEITR